MNTDLNNMVTEEWLRGCPSGLLVLQDGKVRWANELLEQWAGVNNTDIQGLVPSDTEQPRLNKLLERESTILLKSYSGDDIWLQRLTNHLRGPGDCALELHWFIDISTERSTAQERDLLRYKVKELDLTDPLTSLSNRRSLGNALVAQVTRSRRYHNPLSLVMVRIENGDEEAPIPDKVILGISHFLRERLRWADVIGRYTEIQFMLILPETEYADAAKLAETIRDEAGDIVLPPPNEGMHPRLVVGVSQWHKGQDTERLITATLEHMSG